MQNGTKVHPAVTVREEPGLLVVRVSRGGFIHTFKVPDNPGCVKSGERSIPLHGPASGGLPDEAEASNPSCRERVVGRVAPGGAVVGRAFQGIARWDRPRRRSGRLMPSGIRRASERSRSPQRSDAWADQQRTRVLDPGCSSCSLRHLTA